MKKKILFKHKKKIQKFNFLKKKIKKKKIYQKKMKRKKKNLNKN